MTTTFAWNNDGRITGMDLPGTANDPTFRYNGFGTRIDRTVGTSTEVWKRAGAGVTASVLNEGVANFTPGISSRVGSTSTFTHAGLKNTGAQSEFNDNTPAISGTKTYDACGLETATTGIWKTAFGYAGNFGYQKTDAGMKLLGHRYYDPETGRFRNRDPIKDGRNWYAYGAGIGDVVSGVDPSGLALIFVGRRPVVGQGSGGGYHAFIIIICEQTGNQWTISGGPQRHGNNPGGPITNYSGPFTTNRKGISRNYERRNGVETLTEALEGAVLVLDDDKSGLEWYNALDSVGKRGGGGVGAGAAGYAEIRTEITYGGSIRPRGGR